MEAVNLYQKDKFRGIKRLIVRMPMPLSDRLARCAKQMNTTRVGIINEAATRYLNEIEQTSSTK